MLEHGVRIPALMSWTSVSCSGFGHSSAFCLIVWVCGLEFSLVTCSCPVLHMAGDLFCWSCACVFVLCEHMAFVLVFCVPCALMSIVLTLPILFPDYWLVCPTSFFLVTLLICSLYNLLVFVVLCQFVIKCFLFLPRLASPAVLLFPYQVVLVCLFFYQ